ncbi:CHAD domain-containing protein [Pseudomonas sp. DC3000-4b1]|uniref:CHAD domain-containing protein n=1 Tax=unclassified Pseudomonas TaxID=196821 RepID=UPI003CF6FC1B
MSDTLDSVIERLTHIQVRLLHCQARLAAGTDPRALQDLHRALRRLRGLLRPLRGLPGIEHLEGAARALRRAASIERDKERLPAPSCAAQVDLLHTYACFARNEPFLQLLRLLDTLVPLLRTNAHYGVMGNLDKRIRRALDRRARHLRRALASSGSGRQRLRLLIRGLRCAIKAYPKQVSIRRELSRALKRAQDALAQWHACQQRVNLAEQDAALAAQSGQWQAELRQAEHLADQALARLRVVMGKPRSLNARKH